MDPEPASSTPTSPDLPIRELSFPQKGWECQLCGFKSTFKTSLINHQAVHSDARPFECPCCDYAAKRKYDLKKHVQLKHGRNDGCPSFDSTQTEDDHHAVSQSSLSESENGDGSKMDNRSHADTLSEKLTTGMEGPASQHLLKLAQIKSEPKCHEAHEDENRSYGKLSLRYSNPRRKRHDSSAGVDLSRHLSPSRSLHEDETEHLQHAEYGIVFPERMHTNIASSNTRLETPKRRLIDSLFTESTSERKGSKLSLLEDLPDQSGQVYKHRKRQFSSCSINRDELPTSLSGHGHSYSEVSCSSVRTDQACGTKKSFTCAYCDIMYFDHALYLMHLGLHAAGNPWKCAICGEQFGEKYSFASHFINQHSQVST